MSHKHRPDSKARADAKVGVKANPKAGKNRKHIVALEGDDDDDDANGRKQQVWNFKIPKKAKTSRNEASHSDVPKDEISPPPPPTSQKRRPSYNRKPARRIPPETPLQVEFEASPDNLNCANLVWQNLDVLKLLLCYSNRFMI